MAERAVGRVVGEELPGVAEDAVAGFEARDGGADGVDGAGEVVAGDDGPGFDLEACLLGGIDGVYCDGVVVDDDVVWAQGGDFGGGDAEGGVGGVDEGGAVRGHLELIVVESFVGVVGRVDVRW